MSISAMQCFKKEVFAKDKKLGIFVNVFLDKESREARMMVLPKFSDRRQRRGLLGSVDTMGRSVLSTVASEVGYGIGTGIVTDAAYEASRKAQERLSEKSQKESYVYYLLPVSEIGSVEKNKLCLDKAADDYEMYMDMKGTETDVAFFNDEMYKDMESYVYISLNLTAIRGLSLRDGENKKGRIVDVLFDKSTGLITDLILTTVGKGSYLRRVDIDAVDLAQMTLPRKLDDYPEIPPPP